MTYFIKQKSEILIHTKFKTLIEDLYGKNNIIYVLDLERSVMPKEYLTYTEATYNKYLNFIVIWVYKYFPSLTGTTLSIFYTVETVTTNIIDVVE